MDLGEFMKFCVEFRVPCKKELLIEIFKKTATNTKQMTYDEFLVRKICFFNQHFMDILYKINTFL